MIQVVALVLAGIGLPVMAAGFLQDGEFTFNLGYFLFGLAFLGAGVVVFIVGYKEARRD